MRPSIGIKLYKNFTNIDKRHQRSQTKLPMFLSIHFQHAKDYKKNVLIVRDKCNKTHNIFKRFLARFFNKILSRIQRNVSIKDKYFSHISVLIMQELLRNNKKSTRKSIENGLEFFKKF
jgi:hypothetical protein